QEGNSFMKKAKLAPNSSRGRPRSAAVRSSRRGPRSAAGRAKAAPSTETEAIAPEREAEAVTLETDAAERAAVTGEPGQAAPEAPAPSTRKTKEPEVSSEPPSPRAREWLGREDLT